MNALKEVKTIRMLELERFGGGGVDKTPEPQITIQEHAAQRAKEVADLCPDPTREDVHKLLALQAAYLNEYGLKMLKASDISVANRLSFIKYGIALMQESRYTFLSLLKDPTFDLSEADRAKVKRDVFKAPLKERSSDADEIW